MKLIEQSNQQARDFIRKKLIEYNMDQLPDHLKKPKEDISFLLKNDKDEIVGGITGTIYWDHLHVDFLWVDNRERSRGNGTKLLNKIEDFARTRGCNFMFLDTFSFQAPEFYQKNGFEVFGTINNHPVEGHQQYFLIKRF
ncbi:Acetyltransferase (GNAT) family protein [Salinibacillus kushneri]|uniref:Acetyltransferase (GNAT) family protein n=1 Tax=Salinibacillus kushneri TaxID=237682 RepID=A0A1I0FBI5_9BACI|nr:GNAT family N-acetyltransferase [Salinibacillus kushneri]SET54887.1 Acetyltransferase (GNAT) family protein [Salinibacillus kushneri]